MKKIRNIFLIVFIVCFVFSLFIMKKPDTNLLGAFQIKNSKTNYIEKLSNISNNQANIIIESKSKENLENLKQSLENELFKYRYDNEIQEIVEVYKNYPTNFLSNKTKILLKNKDYKTVENNSKTLLYSPFTIFIAPIEKDPYLFSYDFILNNEKLENDDIVEYKGIFYSLIKINLKNNKDIEEIKNIISNFEKENIGNIYLTGSIVHTLETSKKSAFEINTICILSTLMVVLLCLYFFKKANILFLILSSIIFGILFGFCFSTIIFQKLHILTFVFSTSLIGISFDYSLHYFLANNDLKFKKSLFVSMLTTILTFSILYFSNILVLKQIAIFVAFGLVGVYLFVLLVLSKFKFDLKSYDFKIIKLPKKTILAIFFVVILVGFFKLHFDDSIKNIYKPSKKLAKSEKIYKQVFNLKPTNFILIKGDNLENILQNEEKISNDLDSKNISHIGLSSFISSNKKQKENYSLVKNLYKNNLNHYAAFLNSKTKNALINEEFKSYPVDDFNLKENFLIDKNTSFMMVFDDLKDSINLPFEISKLLKETRKNVLKIIPIIFIALYGILRFFFKRKQALKIALCPTIGGIFAICLMGFLNIEINVFHLLAFILIIGFSLDYSIFRTNLGKNSNLAVFISCISTVFSFLLLSFTSFKLISSLGLVLSVGILSSYILSLLLIDEIENI